MGKKQTKEEKYASYLRAGMLGASDIEIHDDPEAHCTRMREHNLTANQAGNFFSAFNSLRMSAVKSLKQDAKDIQHKKIIKKVYNIDDQLQATVVDKAHSEADSTESHSAGEDEEDMPPQTYGDTRDSDEASEPKPATAAAVNPFKIQMDEKLKIIKDLNQDLNEKNNTIASLTATMEDQQRQNSILTQKVEDLQKQMSLWGVEREDLQKQIATLTDKLAAAPVIGSEQHKFNRLVAQAIIKVIARDNDPVAQFLCNAFMPFVLGTQA